MPTSNKNLFSPARLRRGLLRLLGRGNEFRSATYWQDRYAAQGNSGSGSYGRLAQYKAEFLNAFVSENGIQRVMELGCGDGHQLSLATYPDYVGFDVAPLAVKMCEAQFAHKGWRFYRYSLREVARVGAKFKPDMVMSLDVIFHLVEDAIFDDYMRALFSLDPRYVVVYSSDGNFIDDQPHVRNWVFTDWVATNAAEWRLVERLSNPYPFDAKQPHDTSFSNFHLFEKREAGPSA